MDAGKALLNPVRRWTLGAAAAACLALPGCGIASSIDGTAIRGQIGKAILVPYTDARLSEGGIAGVEVSILSGAAGRGGQVVIAKGMTDDSGRFSIRIRDQVPNTFTIRATGEDEYDVRSSITRPNSGERILILMRPPRAP